MYQDIDWPGIRANAVAIGVRAAARAVCSHLPPIEQKRFVDRVMQRSAREGWITRKAEVQAAARLDIVSNAKPLSAIVSTSADGMAKVLSDMGKQTKLGLVKAALNASDSLSKLSGSAVLDKAQAFRHIVSGSSTLHGWEEKQDRGLTLNVGVMLSGMS